MIGDVSFQSRLMLVFLGSAMSWDGHFNLQTESESFSSVIDLLLNCGCFIYIGAWLPFDAFNDPALDITPWRLVVILLSVLVLRRIPSLLLLYSWVPEISGWREALFSGHFGAFFQIFKGIYADQFSRARKFLKNRYYLLLK